MSENKIPLRNEIADSDKWDLSALFSNIDNWEELFKSIESKISEYDKYRGKLHESQDLFVEALLFNVDLYTDLKKLNVFSHLKTDEDKTEQGHLAIYGCNYN